MTQRDIATLRDILDALDGNPDLRRQFHRHLVEVIRTDDLRQELRKEILTEELLRLPARFTRLEEDMTEVKQDVAELKEGQVRMSGLIANLIGHGYEARAIEESRRVVRREMGMEQSMVLYANKQTAPTLFETGILILAIREGRISLQQADELAEADCIIRCDNPDGEVVCAVVEISLTVQDHDRSRAAERAGIFALASGLRTLPFVVGREQEEPGPQAPDVPFLQY